MQLPPLYTSTIFSWPLTETLSLLNSNSFPSLPTPEPHHSTLSLGTSYKWNHTVFVLLGLAHCILYNVCMVCPCRCKWMDFLLFQAELIFWCVCPHIYHVVCTLSGFLKMITYLGLCWVFFAVCRLSLCAESEGCCPVVVCGLLLAVASLVTEYRD